MPERFVSFLTELTGLSKTANNSTVTFRRSFTLAAIFGLLGMPMLPPEHVHVTESEHGHSEIIHRHFESHHHAAPEPEFDHQDEDAALWVDTPFVNAAAIPIPTADRTVVQELPELQPRPLPRWTLEFDHISVHDPPWVAPTGLRAPPASHV